MLRIIERHPTSYDTFLQMNLEGTSLLSLWTLLKDLLRTRSKRTGALFTFFIVSIIYICSIPVFLSAMTGYSIATDTWVVIEGERRGLIRMADIRLSEMVYGARNVTFQIPQCAPSQYNAVKYMLLRYGRCPCQLPDGQGTIPFVRWRETYRSRKEEDGLANLTGKADFGACRFDFPGNDAQFESDMGPTIQCNITPKSTVPFFNQTFEFDDLKDSSELRWCYEGRGYTFRYMQDNTRCLPSPEQLYQWGFSTMLSTVFLIVHFIWSVGMYAVWQDAQLNSKLVRSGFKLTQLRAIFALAAAAERETGLYNEALVRADVKELDDLLFGSKDKAMGGAVISSEIFEAAVDRESSLKKREGTIQEDEA